MPTFRACNLCYLLRKFILLSSFKAKYESSTFL